MKDFILVIRILIGFIGFIMMSNEQQFSETQNWWINLLGLGLILIVCINKKSIQVIKSIL